MNQPEHLKNFYKGKRVLVTGSHGFVGSHLCTALLSMGATVHWFDLKCDRDVTRPADITESIIGVDLVFHLAAETEVRKSFTSPYDTYRTNFYGTLQVLEACRTRGIKKVVVASTDKVYGPQLDPPEEGVPFAQSRDIYSQSKVAVDRLCYDYYKLLNVPVRVVRCVNTYGPGQFNRTTLITSAVLAALKGDRPNVSSANCKREWLYIDDAVEAYLLVGASDARSFAWNVGTGERFTCTQIVSDVLRLLNVSGLDPLIVDPVPKHDYNQHVSSNKFRAWFPDWKPTPFATGLETTVNWYREKFQSGEFQ